MIKDCLKIINIALDAILFFSLLSKLIFYLFDKLLSKFNNLLILSQRHNAVTAIDKTLWSLILNKK